MFYKEQAVLALFFVVLVSYVLNLLVDAFFREGLKGTHLERGRVDLQRVASDHSLLSEPVGSEDRASTAFFRFAFH